MPSQNKKGLFPQRPTLRDYLMIVNMVLFLGVGSIILCRAFFRGAQTVAYLMGGGFLLIGAHRLYLLYKALKGGR